MLFHPTATSAGWSEWVKDKVCSPFSATRHLFNWRSLVSRMENASAERYAQHGGLLGHLQIRIGERLGDVIKLHETLHCCLLFNMDHYWRALQVPLTLFSAPENR